MADLTKQKYLDPGLFVTASFTDHKKITPTVIMDPATNDYDGVTLSIIDDFVSGQKYMPCVVVDPTNGEAAKI